MRGIPEQKIEEWIEDYLLSNLKTFGLREINKVEYYLEDAFRKSMNKLQSNNKTEKVVELYQEQIDGIKFELNNRWLDEIVNEFQHEFPRKIMHYYAAFYGISDQRFERSLDNIVDEVRRVLNRRFENFLEEYHFIINNELKNNISTMGNKFYEFEKKNVDKDKQYNEILNLLGMLGFNLYKVNDKYFVRNDKTGEFTSMEFDENLLKAKDGSRFAFMVSDNQYSYMDEKTDIMLILTDKKMEMTNMAMKDKLSMVEDIDGLKFYSNDVQLNDNDAYNKILLVLKEKVPVYYDNLLTNLEFRTLENAMTKSNEITDRAKEALRMMGDEPVVKETITKEQELERLIDARNSLIALEAKTGDRDLEEINRLIEEKKGFMKR